MNILSLFYKNLYKCKVILKIFFKQKIKKGLTQLKKNYLSFKVN